MAKILIAEDVPEIRFAYEAILVAAGYDVKSVHCGERALEILEKEEFDLLLTDILMPEGDGVFLTSKLCGHINRPKILVVTGGGDRISAHQALSLSEGFFDDSLIKPVKKELLLCKINELLMRKKIA